MKLAEALIERANIKKTTQDILNRINQNLIVDEGEEPDEHPQTLFTELESFHTRYRTLIHAINRTNTETMLETSLGRISIMEAISYRDFMDTRIQYLRSILQTLQSGRNERYEQLIYGDPRPPEKIKQVKLLKAIEVRSELDKTSKERRELDSALQAANWNTEVIF